VLQWLHLTNLTPESKGIGAPHLVHLISAISSPYLVPAFGAELAACSKLCATFGTRLFACGLTTGGTELRALGHSSTAFAASDRLLLCAACRTELRALRHIGPAFGTWGTCRSGLSRSSLSRRLLLLLWLSHLAHLVYHHVAHANSGADTYASSGPPPEGFGAASRMACPVWYCI
jgi:hypothetical protein